MDIIGTVDRCRQAIPTASSRFPWRATAVSAGGPKPWHVRPRAAGSDPVEASVVGQLIEAQLNAHRVLDLYSVEIPIRSVVADDDRRTTFLDFPTDSRFELYPPNLTAVHPLHPRLLLPTNRAPAECKARTIRAQERRSVSSGAVRGAHPAAAVLDPVRKKGRW